MAGKLKTDSDTEAPDPMRWAREGNGARQRNPAGLVAALDVGTTKICCLIARTAGEEEPRVVGIGHQISRGMRGGAVVDMGAAETAIRATVEAAERMAGENIREVTVNVSGGSPTSRLVAYEVSIAGHQIGDADLRRILGPAQVLKEKSQDRELIHVIPVGYRIDGNRGVRDPRGMFGDRLGANVHLIGADAGAMRNLATCIARCHLGIGARVVSPYASATACLAADETKLGVTLIDMGGGTTSMAVFFDDELVHTDVIPIGGDHATNDIARGLLTPLAHAERLKTLHGSVLPSPCDDREILKVPLIGEEDDDHDGNPVPRSMLVGIIRPRVEETLEMVRARLEDAGFDRVVGRRVVLAGGASQLPGTVNLAGQVLDKRVRLGRPKVINGLAEAMLGPAFATCVGLLSHSLENRADGPGGSYRPMEEPRGRFGRLGQWLRENF